MIRDVNSSFRRLIVQGSAVKGGIIPGSSDIDYVLYVDDTGLNEQGTLPTGTCITLHKALSDIDVHPFRYIQLSVITPNNNKYLPPISGAYQLLAGKLLEPEATNDQIFQDAVASFHRLQPEVAFNPHQLLDHGELEVGSVVESFLCSVESYYPQEQSPEKALRLIKDGFALLHATKKWMDHRIMLLSNDDTKNCEGITL
ncbi:hypothetical protein [Paenibacillus alginolyticus]|uniref:Polymerase nucleotidyl transferase domain-containing protein n=1 Tax=Paenibacillus alginolyticus TaxID=59839 RepID=A0ABT4GNL5_9BACL|nr:hypothetical protein [Paenibacillus alginolyticus]MCY9697804.1 hypothetical protein [Paenibacillus alginolyticus]MEC0143719.1 hypothetical protein [Paenibacillus alginolyticus]